MELPRKKKVKVIVTNNYLSFLPEDVFLIVLQYSEEEEIENTRPFQTTWVNKCTLFVDMKKAFHAQNLDNMKWIKERNDEDLSNRTLTYFIEDLSINCALIACIDDHHPIKNIEIVKWLIENGLFMDEEVFECAASNGDLEFMKYLYKKNCPFGRLTFTRAALHGDLGNMIWLYEKKCPFGECTFWLARYGDIENMKWLHEKGCPWDEGTFCMATIHGDIDILEWLYEKGCPWGKKLFRASKNGYPSIKDNVYQWLQEHDSPLAQN